MTIKHTICRCYTKYLYKRSIHILQVSWFSRKERVNYDYRCPNTKDKYVHCKQGLVYCLLHCNKIWLIVYMCVPSVVLFRQQQNRNLLTFTSVTFFFVVKYVVCNIRSLLIKYKCCFHVCQLVSRTSV